MREIKPIMYYLRQAREAAGMKKSQAARAVGVTPQNWNRWEPSGDGPAELEPGASTFLRIMAILKEVEERKRANGELPQEKEAAQGSVVDRLPGA